MWVGLFCESCFHRNFCARIVEGFTHSVRWAGAGDWSGVREKYCWLAGAGAGGWSGVREKYCWNGAGRI